MHLFLHLLTSFSLCISPLGVLLLSSMSVRISAFLSNMSSLTFAAADAVARFIVLVSYFARVAAGVKHDRTCLFTRLWESGTKMLFITAVRMFFTFLGCCRTCVFLVFFLRIGGRCFGSRFPAISSQSPLWLLLLQVQGVDVQPSCRPCSLRAETLRRFATMLQLFMLLLSISSASASSGVRFASAAAAFSLSAGVFVSFILLALQYFFIISTISWYFSSSGNSILMFFPACVLLSRFPFRDILSYLYD